MWSVYTPIHVLRPEPRANLPVYPGNERTERSEPEWEVEAVVDYFYIRRKKQQVLVKWRGYPRQQWVPLTQAYKAKNLIYDYFRDTKIPIPTEATEILNDEKPHVPA